VVVAFDIGDKVLYKLLV